MRLPMIALLLNVAPVLRAEICADAKTAATAVTAAFDHSDLAGAERAIGALPEEARLCPDIAPLAARALLARRQYAQADALSEAAEQRYPNNAAVLALRGQILVMKGSPEAGIELLKKALSFDPHNANAHYQLGMIADRDKRYFEAANHFSEAVKGNPRNPRAWDYFGLNLEPLGRIDEAERAFQEGLKVNAGPQFDPFLDFNYGRLLLKLNRLPESKQHLDRAVESAPRSRAVMYERAKLGLRLEAYEQAERDALRALDLSDPVSAVVDLQLYSLLAQIYRRMGNVPQADRFAELSRTTAVPVRR